MDASTTDQLVSLRRELHRRPEPAWCEFYTTVRIVEQLRELDIEEIHVGPEMLADGERAAVPGQSELEQWFDRARATDIDEGVLNRLDGGYTGAMGVLERGEGPTVALRVDIDGLPQRESESNDHEPTARGFRSEHEGYMHACGHDAHTAIGLGVVRAVANSNFRGTLKVLFQPAEEVTGGARPVARSGRLDDVDALLAIHVGLDTPSGEVVAGVEDFLAVTRLQAKFHGEPAHAGAEPNEGRHAVQAMATAVNNLQAIPRHADGPTRVNAGHVGGGTARNIVPETAFIDGEVRGGTTELMEYAREQARRVLEQAAVMHGCDIDIDVGPAAPSAESDDRLRQYVAAVARESDRVERVHGRDELGGSEDATVLMKRVQARGGIATYVGIGTDHPGGHHTATFDVDESSLAMGVEVLSETIERLGGPDSPL